MSISELDSDTFLDYLNKVNSKNFTGKLKRENEREIKEILGVRKLVLAKAFYNVSALLNLNIDNLLDWFFDKHIFGQLDLQSETDNKLRDFLSPYTLDLKDIAVAADVKYTRLSRLVNGEFTHLYPKEVYGIAKAFGLKPSALFEYFYGDGPRPVVGRGD